MQPLVVGGAGRQKLVEVGEVVVDGQTRHVGAAGDLSDGRMGNAFLLVQLGGGLRDPVARLALAFGPGLQLVFPHSG